MNVSSCAKNDVPYFTIPLLNLLIFQYFLIFPYLLHSISSFPTNNKCRLLPFCAYLLGRTFYLSFLRTYAAYTTHLGTQLLHILESRFILKYNFPICVPTFNSGAMLPQLCTCLESCAVLNFSHVLSVVLFGIQYLCIHNIVESINWNKIIIIYLLLFM